MTDRELEAKLRAFRVDGAPSPTHQVELRRWVLETFDQSGVRAAAKPRWRAVVQRGASIMLHPISRVAAVVALVLAGSWFWLPTRTEAAPIKAWIKPIVEAKTARFDIRITNELAPAQQAKGYFMAPFRYRQEVAGIVSVFDMEKGRMMNLMPGNQALVLNFKVGRQPAKSSPNLFADVRAALAQYDEKSVAKLGTKEIGGTTTTGNRVSLPAEQSIVLWGDEKANRLVQLEITMAGPPKTGAAYSNFEFDVALDEKLFAVEPPAGYTTVTAAVDPAPATEDDFVAALKKYSDLAAGEFPGGFDSVAMAMAMVRVAPRDAKTGDPNMQTAIAQTIELARGFTFAIQLAKTTDAWYAGKDVKRGDAKPLFWYKPAGAAKFRVLRGDLTFVDQDQAPTVGNAKPLHTVKAKSGN